MIRPGLVLKPSAQAGSEQKLYSTVCCHAVRLALGVSWKATPPLPRSGLPPPSVVPYRLPDASLM